MQFDFYQQTNHIPREVPEFRSHVVGFDAQAFIGSLTLGKWSVEYAPKSTRIKLVRKNKTVTLTVRDEWPVVTVDLDIQVVRPVFDVKSYRNRYTELQAAIQYVQDTLDRFSKPIQ